MSVLFSFQAPDLVGTWNGTSTCTDREHYPACHDEQVVYDVREPGSRDTVTLRADKLVNGRREFMGEFDFTRSSGEVWTAEYRSTRVHLRLSLHVSGSRLTGHILDIPSGRTVRQLALERSR